jgi:acyl-CoA thioesterase-2
MKKPGRDAIDLVELLTPRKAGDGVWMGEPGPAVGPRLFGGQALGQALMAASLEDDAGRLAHSLHAYFLRAGTAAEPVEYRVSQLTGGRSFAARRVEAFQNDIPIFIMTASFHAPEEGWSHDAPCPFSLDVDEALAALERWKADNPQIVNGPLLKRLAKRPIDIVPLHPGAMFGDDDAPPITGSWQKMSAPAKADPAMQRALFAYASDMLFLRNALLPHGIRPGSRDVMAASLDHAIWFHETPDFDDWVLYATDSPWAGHARGMNRGQLYSRDGTRIATVMQENLMRPSGEARETLMEKRETA